MNSKKTALHPEQLLAAADKQFTAGNLNGARALLTDAVRQAPQSVEAHVALGFVCFQIEDMSSARDAFACAAELDRRSVTAHTNLAIVLQRMGFIAEAETSLRAALALKLNNPELQQMLAMLLIEQRQFVPAAHILHKLLLQRPSDAGLLVALGKCFYHEGDLDTARDCFQWALQNAPNHELARENLAVMDNASLAVAA